MRTQNFWLCAILAFSLSACGGGGESGADSTPSSLECKLSSRYAPVVAQNSARVTYSGSDLAVDDITYKASDLKTESCVKGELLVMAKAGRLGELTTLIDGFKLRINDSYTGVEGLFISIPVGFEVQWLNALKAQGPVQSVDFNGLVTTQ